MTTKKITTKRFAMILSGCGGLDGTEIHEATSLMLAIKQEKIDYMCFAIDENQKYTIHSNKPTQQNEERNMLTEAGRLNHGKVYNIKKLNVKQFDALIFPGGYGTATSLSNFITCDNNNCIKNLNYSVRDEIKDIIRNFHEQGKPIFAGCMAPVLINGSLTGITIMTNDTLYTKEIIEKNGNHYEIKVAEEICIDSDNKIVTAPYYMAQNADIRTIYVESVKGIKEIIKMCK